MLFRWFTVIAMVLSVVSAQAAEVPAPTPLRLLVPAYFYPDGKGLDEWKRMVRAAKDVPIVAIANPASGAGARVDPSYTSVLDLARKAGITVIGYVSTRYGKRSEAEVRADIDRWVQFYPGVDGFFFDEQASGKETVPYYEAIARYVQQKQADRGGLVVTNPGTGTAPDYLTPWKGIHISCLYEDHGGLDRYQRPSWTTSIPAAQVAGLVYGEASISKMRENVRLAASKGVGFVYVTDDGGNNPWDRLPTYWELEVAELRSTFPGGTRPGIGTDVPAHHWAYDALQLLAQEGIFTGYPDGILAGKRTFTRLQFGTFTRNILQLIGTAQPPKSLPAPGRAKTEVSAVEKLCAEFRVELELHGITAERAAATVRRFAASLGLPKRQ